MKKDTQVFVKQTDLTCSLARHREYDRKRCAVMSMPEKEGNLSRRRECDRVRETNVERQARFAMLMNSRGE